MSLAAPTRAHLSLSAADVRAAAGRWGLRGTAILYLLLMIAVPVVAVVSKGFGSGFEALRGALATDGAVEALRMTLLTALGAAVVNAVFGTLIAFVLVRYRFRAKSLLSAIVDVPFAIPTLVTGVMIVALYGPASPVGGWLADHGFQIVYATPGVLMALLFITLPFVVRTVQPVLSELDVAEEEAAFVLGARPSTTLRRVVLPALRPAIAAGALLSFARAIGEFGSIVIVSGNLTGRTLTAPVFIFQLSNRFEPEQAAAVSTVLFAISFTTVLLTYRLIRRREAP